MIDKRYQCKGYDNVAMLMALDFIRTFSACMSEWCWLSHEPKNVIAKKLYTSLGLEWKSELYEEGAKMP